MKYSDMATIRTDCDTIIENLDIMIARIEAIKVGVREIGSHKFCQNADYSYVDGEVAIIATSVDYELEDAITTIEKVVAEI